MDKQLRYQDFETLPPSIDRHITTYYFGYTRAGYEITIEPSMEGFNVCVYKEKAPKPLQSFSTGFQKVIQPTIAFKSALVLAQRFYDEFIKPRTSMILLDDLK